MKRISKPWIAGLLLVLGGATAASNMGFKLTPNMTGSHLTYTISLPLNHGYSGAVDLLLDIQSSGCNPERVTRIVPSPGAKGTISWIPAGGVPGGKFQVKTGSGLPGSEGGFDGFLVVSSGSCTSWTIAGTHNPGMVYNFDRPNVTYLLSIPYHTTAMRAAGLLAQIGPNANRIARIVPSAGGKGTASWVPGGGIPGGNFAVTMGEAYLVTISAPTLWMPPHY